MAVHPLVSRNQTGHTTDPNPCGLPTSSSTHPSIHPSIYQFNHPYPQPQPHPLPMWSVGQEMHYLCTFAARPGPKVSNLASWHGQHPSSRSRVNIVPSPNWNPRPWNQHPGPPMMHACQPPASHRRNEKGPPSPSSNVWLAFLPGLFVLAPVVTAVCQLFGTWNGRNAGRLSKCPDHWHSW